MLQKLRNKKTSKRILITLAVIIIPPFVFWGSGSLLRNKQEPAFAGKIFGKKISYLEYENAKEAVRNAAIMQFGDKYSEVKKYIDIDAQTWERLRLIYEAKRRKISASNEEVIELIESFPFFQNRGRFNDRFYNEIIRYTFRTQPRIFEEQIRQNIMISKLYKEITEGVKLNDEQIKEAYIKQNEEISLFYIVSSPADFAKDIKPSEEELQGYFNNKSLEFKKPLSLNAEYISSDNPDKIKNALLQLKKKDKIEAVAKRFGLAVKETGLFTQADPIPGIGWSTQISNMLAEMKENGISNIINLENDYFIFIIKERKEAHIPNYASVKDKVKEAYIKENSEKMAMEKINACLDKLKELNKLSIKLANFPRVAKEFKLKYATTDLFKYGAYLDGIGTSELFWTTARGLEKDGFSDIINMPSGFYIIKIKSIKPIDENNFLVAKEEFADKLLLQRKQDSFEKFLDELKGK